MPTDEIPLPDGSTALVDQLTQELDIGYGVLTVHLHRARLRTIARWRDKPVFAAIRDVVAKEIQLAENALWQVKIYFFIDQAFGESLDLLGRIVGEARDGRDDPGYRVRIKARIRVNQSFGGPEDILEVLALLDPDNTFLLSYTPPAAFVVGMASKPAGFATADEMAELVGEASAAGVGVFVAIRTDDAGFILGHEGGTLLTSTLGHYGSTTTKTSPLPHGVRI